MTKVPRRVRSRSCATSFDGILHEYAASPEHLDAYVDQLNAAEAECLLAQWRLRCRPGQRPPEDGEGWSAWLVLGGRGAGKTRTGAEWMRGCAFGDPGFSEPRLGRLALVGETFASVRDVMVEGPSGILAVHDGDRRGRPVWSPALRRLDWPNGAVAHAFPPRIRTACAARNSAPPGRMSSRNGAIPRRPGTCCNSGCGSGRPRAA